MARNEVISKSEAARRWKVSKAAVTKYVHAGLPERSDGRLDWPLVDSWRTQHVGEEPTSPRLAREGAKPHREIPIGQTAADQALEVAGQAGRWAVHQALVGPAALERTLKVLLRLGFTPNHAFQAAYWSYLSPIYCDAMTERDLNGPGEIQEPDWKATLPAGKLFDMERAAGRVEVAMTELFSPELVG
jgi:hypothetical protein